MTDYEKIYQEGENALGEPFPEFVDFFKQLYNTKLQVLDLGCGQGRDALFIARMGHHVFGVDSSMTGIKQLLNVAEKEKLNIEGKVDDIVEYSISKKIDIVILDRVLHMVNDSQKKVIIRNLKNSLVNGGYVLIADMPKNKPWIKDSFNPKRWKIILDKKGFIFFQKVE